MELKILVALLVTVSAVHGQFYEDKRCRCICPSLAALVNNSLSDRKLYTANVPPTKCNCEDVILPIVGSQLEEHEQEFCPRCECKYERRNTTVIMVVVIMTLWLLTMLSGYMGFLMCLDPLMNKKKTKSYHESEDGCEEARTLLMPDDPED